MNDAIEVGASDIAGEVRWTVDELARRSGLTTRTIRAHQSAELLPRPRLDGRTGYYGRAHLERLGVITRLQGRGYSLAAITDLLRAWDDGRTLADVLGFDRPAPTAGRLEREQPPDWVDELFTAFVTPYGPAAVLPAGILN
jgi:DNA-binding transcriptional MerR regulator